jgi:hypothetical protein
MDDSILMSFKAVTAFVKDLNDVFGKRQKSLALYARLIEKTGIVHEKPIEKHLEAFKAFCIYNRDAISSQNKKILNNPKISYNDRVFIDMSHIFSLCENDSDTTDIIWKHILTISALLDPTSNAKKILKDSIDKNKNNGNDSKEEEFISSLIDKVEQSIDPTKVSDNPMQAISSMMSSGVITDLIGNMQSGLSTGELNLGRLMSTVQGMMTKMGGPSMENMSSPMPGMPGMPDLSMMMNMLGGMNMSNLPQLPDSDKKE